MAKTNLIDRMRGCLVGGAVGDALGYPVEFHSLEDIIKNYGVDGITAYPDGIGYISDDTQMTLFTAEGLLRGKTWETCIDEVRKAYIDWKYTQDMHYAKLLGDNAKPPKGLTKSWLLGIPQLYRQRAPGGTCLTAIGMGAYGTIEDPINSSKGCGGIMRVAPAGMLCPNAAVACELGAGCAALTHGHELGFITAGMLSCLISVILNNPNWHLKRCIKAALEVTRGTFWEYESMKIVEQIVDDALESAENGKKFHVIPFVDIDRLGEGWVAEETLGIAIYCATRYETSFADGVIAAVNHDGDSDSTGAVTGNILGAYLGESAIPENFKQGLELYKEIEHMADMLAEKRKK